MKIDFEDRVWQFDTQAVDLEQGEKIIEHSGCQSVMAWWKTVTELEEPVWPRSMQCFYWLLHEQNGDPVPIDSKKFFPMKLLAAFNEAAKKDLPAEAAEADPTNSGAEPAAAELTPSAVSLPG